MKKISTYPFICKICGLESNETKLICDKRDFCICQIGFGCKKNIEVNDDQSKEITG